MKACILLRGRANTVFTCTAKNNTLRNSNSEYLTRLQRNLK